jgi:uncharacterized protein YdeI (YjbR/CyaY-like superfamily)
MAAELPELTVPGAEGWRDWLAEHHADPTGVWLRLAKKGYTEPTSLTYDQALDEAICQGWIDGQIRRADGASFWQRFTPRRARSIWSANNVVRVERLTAEGRMQPAGLAQVEAAKANGRWEAAYAGQASIDIPDDLAAALAANPAAQAMFGTLTSQNRYAILHRLHTGSARTRADRLEKFVAMLARGETIHPQRGRPAGPAPGGGRQ